MTKLVDTNIRRYKTEKLQPSDKQTWRYYNKLIRRRTYAIRLPDKQTDIQTTVGQRNNSRIDKTENSRLNRPANKQRIDGKIDRQTDKNQKEKPTRKSNRQPDNSQIDKRIIVE